ncbi:MAG: endonuclease III [archaeon]|nr:endonuclease III [archaeon]MDD2477636.1 endonuclease III [Candidatus ainarchaeum sp.]MDD3084269.1 endonuclease III [Candidatus ainarchaeum sp.]MDD4221010.1 endonuclease III [Candidatus ainarchaeum sp.]MDD4662482.1 endonuclease III [Candidatus ainarchaeum sp.]
MEKINIEEVYKILERELKDYTIPLAEQIQIKTKKPFFVLIGTILSARTKDKVTAKVCNKLFLKVKTIEDLKKIKLESLEKILKPIGMYKTKARHLKELPLILEEKFENIIPQEIEELIELAGVGRKTANLVRSVAFKLPAICVDTHVFRIMNRIGYTDSKNPLETEMILREKLPPHLWEKTNHLFVILGQNICKPRIPNCSKCPLKNMCPRNNVERYT